MKKIIVIALAFVSVVVAEGGLFVPHELPCAHTAEYEIISISKGKTYKSYGYQSMYGESFNVLSYDESEGHKFSLRDIFRPDIKDPNDPSKGARVSVFADKDSTSCNGGDYEEPYLAHDQSPVYDLITEGFDYTWEENTTFDDKECVSYFRSDQYGNHTIYADFDGWVIARVFVRDVDYKYTTIITSFTNISYLDDFYAPKDRDCEEFPGIFKAPPLIPGCDIPEHRPKSDAASHFTSLVLLLMALVFLFF